MNNDRPQIGKGYRIPSIDEFKHGFKFEVFSEGYFDDSIEDIVGWYKYTYGVDSWRDLEEIERELEKGFVRARISKL